MEHVVRGRNVLQRSAVAAAVLGLGLLAVAVARSDSPAWTFGTAVVSGAFWSVVMWAVGSKRHLELHTVTQADLPAIEPGKRTTAKVFVAHLVGATIFLALLFTPFASAILPGVMLGMAVLYLIGLRRLAKKETDQGGAIFSSANWAWTSKHAKARTDYLVPFTALPTPTTG